MKKPLDRLIYGIALSLSCMTSLFAADVNVNAQSMLENIATSVPSLMRLVTAIAYVLGMIFIIRGIMEMKHLGESRTMMSRERSVRGPLVTIVIGSLLLYLPTSVQVGLSTFWTTPCAYCYLNQQGQWQSIINTVYIVIQLIGVIAFIRGLLIMSQLGHEGHQQGVFAKGLTHIIGGLFCINIYQFVQLIQATFGITVS